MEFIDFSEEAESEHSQDSKIYSNEEKAKLLKIANTMLNSGADSKEILKVLPISESELITLKNNIQK